MGLKDRSANESIEHYKVHLLAKDYTHIKGLDFHDTFAPVAKLITLRYLLVDIVARRWDWHQLDISIAFLHSDLHEEVYMLPSHGLLG